MGFIDKKFVNLPLQSNSSQHGGSVVMADEEDSRTNEGEGFMPYEIVEAIRGASGNSQTIVTAFSRLNSQETFLIVVFLDFQSTKQGLSLVDSWSHVLD